MLKIIKRRRIEAQSIPPHLTTLSVSWLNNQFKVVAVHRGAVTSTWERPGETDGPGNFETFIREAVQQTGYRGNTVSLLISHPRLIQQLLDVPPAKEAALQKIIQRQAQQQKMFSGDAAWASQMLPAGKGMQRVMLHLFPRALLNQFIQGCKRNGLDLTAVLPASVVLHSHLTQLPLGKGEAALLAAETGGSTTTVVGRGDGEILLARTLPGSWNDDTPRLALDLNRTLLFVNQQYGAASNHSVWLFGPGADRQRQVVQDHIQFPVKVSPVHCDPFYWATEAVKLQPEHCPNLISPELRTAPQRRAFAKVVAVATALLLTAALATAAYAYLQATQDRAAIKTASSQIVELENKERELRQLDAELTRQQEVVEFVEGERPPPAPAWFLAYLGEVVPSDLVVTNLHVLRGTNQWRFKLAGTVQHAIKTPTSPSLTDSIRLLKDRLSGAPFYLRFVEDREKAIPPETNGSLAGWLHRAASEFSGSRPPLARTDDDNGFVIEGIMR